MTSRIAMMIVLLTALAVALSFSQTAPKCPAQASADKASCCSKASHASMTSKDAKSTVGAASEVTGAKIVEVSDKEAKAKDEKKSTSMKDCPNQGASMKDCANHSANMKDCPMHGAEKTAMKSGAKDCCKDPSKCPGMKQKTSSTKKNSSDEKGTE